MLRDHPAVFYIVLVKQSIGLFHKNYSGGCIEMLKHHIREFLDANTNALLEYNIIANPPTLMDWALSLKKLQLVSNS